MIIFQGWRSRQPDWDVTHAMVQAVAIAERGVIPARDNLTDYNSFFPPGTTWLTVPGVLLFDDPRLVELFGSALLYVLTIAGVLAVGRRYFGIHTALLAVVIYALSYVALRLGSELWPRGHPVFYIWMLYCAGRWVDRRNAWYLGAACAVWAAGLYVHLETAPAIFMLPAVWWYYRPPVRRPPIVLAALFAFVMWTPYLAFEWQRGFIDVQSQVMRRTLSERGDEVFGCGHVVTANPALLPAEQSGADWLRDRGPATIDLLFANLQSRVLAGELILLALLCAGVVVVVAAPHQASRWRALIIPLAALAGSIVVSEFTLRWMVAPDSPATGWLVVVRRIHALLLIGIALSMMRERRAPASDARFVVIALLAPWAILLLLTEPGRSERLFGVWPLQVLLIAAGVGSALVHGHVTRARRWAAYGVVVALVAANLVLLGRSRDWMAYGWSGHPAPAIAAGFRTLDCD